MATTGAQRPPDEESLVRIAARRAARRMRAEAATPEFGRLLILQACSAAGDALIALALAGSLFFSIPAAEAKGRVVLYLVLTMAPFAVVGPLLARYLDAHRGGLRTAMFLSSLGRAFLALMLGSRIDSLWLFPIAFGVLVLSRAQVVVRGALLPHVVPEGRSLVEANSLLSKVAALAGAIGLLPGVLLLQYPGLRTMLVFAAAVYAVGAPAAFGLPRARGRRTEVEQLSARAGVGAVAVRQAIVAAAGMRLIVGFLVFHLAFALRREEVGNIGLAALVGGATLGGFLGAAVAPRLRRALKEEGMLALSLFLAAAAGFIGGRWFSLAAALALVLLLGVASGASKVAFDSIVQRDIPEAARGYAFARFESTLQLAWVAGGFIAVLVPIPSGPGVAGAGAIALILMGLYIAGRSRARTSGVP
jgi:hypothetical protein